jgi:hypothetical protein
MQLPHDLCLRLSVMNNSGWNAMQQGSFDFSSDSHVILSQQLQYSLNGLLYMDWEHDVLRFTLSEAAGIDKYGPCYFQSPLPLLPVPSHFPSKQVDSS